MIRRWPEALAAAEVVLNQQLIFLLPDIMLFMIAPGMRISGTGFFFSTFTFLTTLNQIISFLIYSLRY